ASKYDDLARKFESHSKCIKEMKVDLEYIFKKIRIIKTRISAQYPDIFEQVEAKFPRGDDDDDE
ncbi:14585_t:CDS:2, partial [Acaulospora morrowiae]